MSRLARPPFTVLYPLSGTLPAPSPVSLTEVTIMLSLRRFASVASVASFLALGSLAQSGIALASPAPPPSVDAGPGAGHHGHHGRGDLLRASLHLDSLTTAQRQQIEALAQQERATHANVAAARGQLLQALATRVAAGSVDDAALAPSVQAVEGAIEADEPGDRASLEKLHAILTPAQRVELVTRIESHTHRAVERAPDAGGPGGMRGGLLWGHALDLTPAQRDQIKANLASSGPAVDKSVWKEARESRQHVLEAFKGDRFVMNEGAPQKDPRMGEQGIEHIVRIAKASAPVLTAEQRATAAAKLQKMATRATK
jgi:Spy/CpxP family protein refolding chaperone